MLNSTTPRPSNVVQSAWQDAVSRVRTWRTTPGAPSSRPASRVAVSSRQAVRMIHSSH